MQQTTIGIPQRDALSYPPHEYMVQSPYQNEDSTAHNPIRRDSAVANTGKASAFRTKVCRYYQSGYCRLGSTCPFKHSLDDQSDSEVDKKKINKSPSKMQATSRTRPSISIPPAPYPVYPAYLCSPAWSPQANTPPMGANVPVHMIPSTFVGHPFDPSMAHHLSPTGSQSSLLDELGTPLEEHQFSEPFIRRQSFPITTPNSASGFYVPIASPGSLPIQYVDRFGVPSTKTGGRSHHNRHSSAPSSRKLAAAFKTKHCKFWRQDGNCPNGSKCTFIHDEDAAAYQSSDDDSTDVASVSSQPPYDLPAKPLSAIEEKKKRGFYPISWRVIGGGVMMSGKRDVCHSFMAGRCENGDECPFSHETGSDYSVSQPSDFDPNEALTENDAVYPPASPPGDLIRLEERPKPSAGSKSKASRPMSISVPPAKDFFLASNSAQPTAVPGSFHGNQDDKQSPGSSTCHRRARSMTIPQKPGSPRSGATVNLFPAESPGGL